jgi:hypothetical protein
MEAEVPKVVNLGSSSSRSFALFSIPPRGTLDIAAWLRYCPATERSVMVAQPLFL